MGSYDQVFGGTTIYPSDVSYLALALTANATLQWPLEANTGPDIVARIIDVTPTGAYSITMPPASQTGTGQTILFNNLGPSTITVLDNDGDTLLSLTQGQVWQIYLTNNSTDAGDWRVFQYGASTASAQASALAGYGILAMGSLLSQTAPATVFNSNYALGVPDRAGTFVWNGASGTLAFLASADAGNGYFALVRNGGSGQLTMNPAGSETINGASTLVLQPNDSVIVISSGTDWYTIGYGQDAVFAFDYTSISLTGEVDDYTLTGAELNRISYSFTGVLTTDMEIIVPATTQQYWVSNDTTGSFILSVRATDQVTGIAVAQGARAILYCDGTNVVDATTGGIATPISVSDGGTGSTTAGGALINLGGTTVGIGVFTAATAALARTAIGAAGTDSPTFVDDITLGTQQTTRGSIILCNTAAGAYATTLQGSNSASAAWTLTLPTTAGTSGYVLTTDGAGVTSWTASSAGSAAAFVPTGSSVPTNGMYLPAANRLGFATNTTARGEISATGTLLWNTTTDGGWSGNTGGFVVEGRVVPFSARASTGGICYAARLDDITGKLASFYYTTTLVGSISTDGSTTTYGTTSDERLKTKLESQRDFGAIIDGIWVGDFEFKADPGTPHLGVMAQQVLEHYPDPVHVPAGDGIMSVDYGKLSALVLWGLKDLRKRVEALENAQK